ncbi:MAG TPA: tRNA 2-thiouridine(34) synthase MnmA [Opitutaceae bacterium]|jgi:tRNA-specific 2-thiouridylase|nr:tRNA 2-thiouridine(34) synthase MnmA [Opitutaceae bacterium]
MRILVAMSGGVDSSVAALLLKQQGFAVVGAYMKNWINEPNIIGHCPWQQDIDDARAVAEQIGLEFRVVNLMQDYRRLVVDYLLDGYARGLTPNPDIMCNREIKFGVFRAYAKTEGFAAVATGHYARRVEAETAVPGGIPVAAGAGAPALHDPSPAGRGLATPPPIDARKTTAYTFSLLEGVDKNKDQSYFLALLSQAQLREARFPIGHLRKPELRTIAADHGLVTARKKDSQGICFIGEVKMQDFLRAYVPDAPGPIVRATDGKEIGCHRGLHYYTMGQRRGIGIPSNTDFQAYVVVGKRVADHALLVAFDTPDAPGLFVQEIRVRAVSWIGEPVIAARPLAGRVRYRDPRVPLEFVPAGDGTALIRFVHPQRALASGQILALYDGEQLLGGGVYV